MIDDSNKHFDKVYNKLIDMIEAKADRLIKLRTIGKQIDYTMVKTLNLYINYLESVKNSKYTYFTIDSLNNISNYLNTL